MVHEALLNAYVFDFLKKKGFHQTAIQFADECKDLPLIKPTDDDSQTSNGVDNSTAAISAKDEDSKNQGTGSSSSSKQKSPTPSAKNSDTLSPTITSRSMPGVNVPINTPRGFLLEWWSVFWDVFAASSERSSKHQVPESIRAYVNHQQTQRQGRKLSTNANNINVNGNGKRSALQAGSDPEDSLNPLSVPITGIDGLGSIKRSRLGDEVDRSPQSAALVAKYSFSDSIDLLQLPEQQHQHQQQSGNKIRNMASFPRNLGVNISPGGAHTLSDEYTGFLSRSLRMVAEGKSAHSSNDSMKVPTQRAASQKMSSPPSAPAAPGMPNAANSIHAMQRLMSPPPPSLPMASPMISNASAQQNDLRRASVVSMPYALHTAAAPGGTLQQRVGSVGPPQQQPPPAMRQQTMPAGFGNSAIPNHPMLGLNPADLGLHGSPNAFAVATGVAAAAAAAGLGPVRSPAQAMMGPAGFSNAHFQQQQQQKSSHLDQGGQQSSFSAKPSQAPTQPNAASALEPTASNSHFVSNAQQQMQQFMAMANMDPNGGSQPPLIHQTPTPVPHSMTNSFQSQIDHHQQQQQQKQQHQYNALQWQQQLMPQNITSAGNQASVSASPGAASVNVHQRRTDGGADQIKNSGNGAQ
ncbi:hypothetical protein LPJ64_001277, partial [Coemansia asiatica]